jgi:hypothetical protein
MWCGYKLNYAKSLTAQTVAGVKGMQVSRHSSGS